MELVVVSDALLRRRLMNAIQAADIGVPIGDVSLSIDTALCPPPEHDEKLNLAPDFFVAARFKWYNIHYRVIVGTTYVLTDKSIELIKKHVQTMIDRSLRHRRVVADMLKKHNINVNTAFITSVFKVVPTAELETKDTSPWSLYGPDKQYVRIYDFTMSTGNDTRMSLVTSKGVGERLMDRFTLKERRKFTQLFVHGWYGHS